MTFIVAGTLNNKIAHQCIQNCSLSET